MNSFFKAPSEAMTDLEITRLCAAAMDIPLLNDSDTYANSPIDGMLVTFKYNPLHDDAQAMALVKKFGLEIMRYRDFGEPETEPLGMCAVFVRKTKKWSMELPDDLPEFNYSPKYWYGNLNRAICECIAKMQKAKP